MKEVLQFLLLALSPNKDDGSYIELDSSMKKKLKLGAIISVVFFFFIVTLTLYFYFKWEPIRQLTDNLKTTIIDTVDKTGDFPKWFFKVVTIMLILTFGLSLIFSYLLIDLAKLHYRLDGLTFRAIKKINIELQQSTLNHLKCNDKANCNLKNKLKKRQFSRRFSYEFFYFFTNQDKIGSYNQKDKRREVFNEWSKYYIINFSFISIILCYLWSSSLLLIKLSLPFIISLVILLGILSLIVFWYIKIGKKYREKLIEIGVHQINIIFSEVPGDATKRLKSVFGDCFENDCKLK